MVHFKGLVADFLLAFILSSSLSHGNAFVPSSSSFGVRPQTSTLFLSDTAALGKPSDLPDSLEDAAEIAARSSASFAEAAGNLARCRVDFDTSAGDETYPILKTSSEFMQKYVTALSYALIPGLQQQRQNEMMNVATARAELLKLKREQEEKQEQQATATAEEKSNEKEEDEEKAPESDDESADDEANAKARKMELQQIIVNGGRDPTKPAWEGPKVRVYFPDEGNAALARRDWNPQGPPDEALVPPCVEFASCGGVQMHDLSNDMLILFFCPKASESESVEKLLYETEEKSENLKLSVMVNPNLVDMGVTGFGMAGRLLRERLLDGLTQTYYLRTLQWGALTRIWPQAFSVWQEDENADGGYRLIRSQDRLPSNPEVEDIYDIENGLASEKESGGFLDQFGDFVNGMMRL